MAILVCCIFGCAPGPLTKKGKHFALESGNLQNMVALKGQIQWYY